MRIAEVSVLLPVEGDVAQGIQDPGDHGILIDLHLGQAIERAVNRNADQKGVQAAQVIGDDDAGTLVRHILETFR